ncbi:MAG: alpha/beta hydrolase [Lachnospiraceae bacterium]|nr:alpha/beta hydrolase [Lachnospiraceae bacterium]
MLYHAKNCKVQIGNTSMSYAVFGNGEKNLIMIPGLGDGLRADKKAAHLYALLYGKFTKNYRVYVFSQKKEMPDRYSTRKMAKDVKEAMDILGIEQADVIGVSLGGMIAQHLAADYPEKIGKLVLVVSSARKNQYIQAAISGWIEMAKRGDYRKLMIDNLKKMYTKEYLEKNKWMMAVAGKIGKPKSYERFIIMAKACIYHDAYEKLEKIQAKTFVIGGELDRTVGAKASYELVDRIPNSTLKMYPQYGHALYEEAKDFNQTVLEFLQEE